MSGNIAYNERVNILFYFIPNLIEMSFQWVFIVGKWWPYLRIGEDLIQIQQKVIVQITKWNRERRDDIALDKKVFGSLLLCLAKQEDLDSGYISEQVMAFIKGKTTFIQWYWILFLKLTILSVFSAILSVRSNNTGVRVDAIDFYKQDVLRIIAEN